jgi:hypothetical protein
MSNPTEEPDEPGGPPRAALIALIVIAVLIAGGIWLSHSLHDTSRLQDCVMAGRTNCAPVGQPAR